MRSPYPLQWPENRSRTKPSNRRASRFGGTSIYAAAKGVLSEMRLLGSSHVVITSMLPTRQDGLPYSDGRSDDPGIAVWFVKAGRERVFACDAWRTHAENLRAIELSIEAMRGLERWQMADVVELTMAGFASLPAGTAAEPARQRHWRDVLGVGAHAHVTHADLKTRHRELISKAHPDAGGSHDKAAEINAAFDEAVRKIGQGG